MQRFVIAIAVTALTLAAAGSAQQPMGSVALTDARVSGALEISAGHATLVSNDAVTALGHTAEISLVRGGNVALCATSSLHLLHSGSADALLFSLDRGAAEIRTGTRAQDIVLTPDLRFAIASPGMLDLRLRVSPEGDTCVDNRGAGAPALAITEAFGPGLYRLRPGQHVLFEHGSLRSVVDNERSNCGCPQATPAMTASGGRNATATPDARQAAAEHPFPEAASTGLVSEAPPLDAAAAKPATDATLSVQTAGAPGNGRTSATSPSATSPSETATSVATRPPAAGDAAAASSATDGSSHSIGRGIGNFFRRLFGRKPV